jgi:hypothetical protein
MQFRSLFVQCCLIVDMPASLPAGVQLREGAGGDEAHDAARVHRVPAQVSEQQYPHAPLLRTDLTDADCGVLSSSPRTHLTVLARTRACKETQLPACALPLPWCSHMNVDPLCIFLPFCQEE